MEEPREQSVCVAIPCYNEELTVGKVITDFREKIPNAAIVVLDNNSTDATGEVARSNGARVIFEPRQGKGNAIQAIFQKVDCDVIVMVDGDDTYPAEEVHKVLAPVLQGEADMVVGSRLEGADGNAFPSLHRFGNRLLTGLLNKSFGSSFRDILSGYRAFSKNFIRHVPLVTPGFEIETELTLQALACDMLVKEVPVHYRTRPPGSQSKLRSFADGYRILMTIAVLLRDRRPLAVFSTAAIFLAVIAFAGISMDAVGADTMTPLGRWWLRMASIWCLSVSALSLASGFILNAINTRFREMRSLAQRYPR
jgi:glycosyltransferase involved in cell wall biosynthesis